MLLVVVLLDHAALRGEGIATRTDKQNLAALIADGKHHQSGRCRHWNEHALTRPPCTGQTS
jgi:hypothetical protein